MTLRPALPALARQNLDNAFGKKPVWARAATSSREAIPLHSQVWDFFEIFDNRYVFCYRASHMLVYRQAKAQYVVCFLLGMTRYGVINAGYSFSEKYLQICGMNGPDNHVKLGKNDVELNSAIRNPQSAIGNTIDEFVRRPHNRWAPNHKLTLTV
ncbi:MAG: hypothetical protein BA865_11460 [Desulfobacterales bacterium S5133MH4]|nr:MAG: hypothetical protein BA865_11460 [Desulfobacterales bacterium S5133MH4]